jgi:cytochrome c oxidase subunit III
MPVFSAPVTVEHPKSGHGGGRSHPPADGRGGDGDRGDGAPDYGRRLFRARLALALGMVSISVLFVTVTAVFAFLRHGAFVLDPRTSFYVRQWIQVALPVRLLTVNTVVLLASSVTLEGARRAIAREMVLAPIGRIPGIVLDRERGLPWLTATIGLGIVFLGGQWAAWRFLAAQGYHISTRTPTPFFYILTGAHAVHLVGGVIVLMYAGMASLANRPVEHRRIVIEVASWYWHFMGALWIYIFALLEFGG